MAGPLQEKRTVDAAPAQALSDVDYVDRLLDPVLRPLIDDMCRRMPKNCMDFIRKWVENPPPLNVPLYERRRYYDVILAPVAHSLGEEAVKRRPKDVLAYYTFNFCLTKNFLRTMLARII